MEEIVNKVAASGLVTIDLEEIYPTGERVSFDIANHLWQGLALREKDFREFIKENDWESYRDKYVAICCSVGAIVPNWAYMLIASKLEGVAKAVVFGGLELLEFTIFNRLIDQLPKGVQQQAGSFFCLCGFSDQTATCCQEHYVW